MFGAMGQNRPKKAPAARGAEARRAGLPRLGEPVADVSRERAPWTIRHAAPLTVLAAIVFLALVRLRVADVPLERDEGEYAYAGQLILEGIPPFQMAYNMKFPGTYYAYSVILAVFGQTAWGVHVGVLAVNAATILILFLLARRLLRDPMAAAVAAIAYGFLSIDRWTLAISGHATHFVVIAALGGLLVLFYAIDSRRWVLFLAAGALLGVSVLMKQNGIFFLALGVGIAIWSAFDGASRAATAARRVALVGLGSAVPVVILFVSLYAQGVFGRFWFWTIQYVREYVSEVSVSDAWNVFGESFEAITQANAPIWFVGALGVILLWLAPWSRNARVLLSAFLVVSAAAVCPGFFFRRHYFILALPAVSLFCGVAVASIHRLLGRIAPAGPARAAAVLVFGIAVAVYAHREWDYFFSIPTRQLSRIVYGANPFVESLEIAKYIQSHTGPEDRVAVLGSEPQIFFYANRKSATGYIYTYPLMEQQKYAVQMQDEMIAEVAAAHPKYMVFVTVDASWLARDRNARILTWAQKYVEQCYRIVGVSEIISETETKSLWDGEAAGYRPQSASVVYTLARRSAEPCMVLQ